MLRPGQKRPAVDSAVDELRTGDLPLQIAALQELYLDKRLVPAVCAGAWYASHTGMALSLPCTGRWSGGKCATAGQSHPPGCLDKRQCVPPSAAYLPGRPPQPSLQLSQLGLVFPIAGIGQGFVVCRAEGDFRVCVHGFHIALQEPEGLGGVALCAFTNSTCRLMPICGSVWLFSARGSCHVAALHIGGIEPSHCTAARLEYN